MQISKSATRQIFTASRRDANWCGVKNFFFSISLSTVSEMNYLSKCCFVKIMKRNLRDYIYNFHCKSTGKNSSKDQNSVSCAKKIEGRGSSTGKLPSVGGGGGMGYGYFLERHNTHNQCSKLAVVRSSQTTRKFTRRPVFVRI